MHFTGAEIAAWIGSYLWPLFRVGAMIVAMPVFGSILIPVRVRLMLALAVTSIVAPVLPAVQQIDPLSLEAVLIALQQILIGVAMGFAMQLVFNAVTTGGQIIAMQMGLGFASMVDPQNGTQVPVLSQLYLLLVTLLFLGFNGHLVMIEMVAESFSALPVAADGLTRNGLWTLANLGTQMFAGALWLALPAVASLLVVNIAFGVMARAAPQLNIFAIGFPVTLMMGFVVILFTLPAVVPQFESMVNDGFGLIVRLLARE
ncbi:MAG: flagellar biosynthetic protein FliR [Gammaproteobacteria bacterium HGW-Gammaproteobacteria-1]|jgi:flagellar biosynthetic protein FliR|nr:MAG: flagellar biosynthetic protein FliR [Gammaproteobacteria bacterium HGW-Gammaproteobacteria-1]